MKRFAMVSVLILLVTLAGVLATQRGAAPAPASQTSGNTTAKAIASANAFLGMLEAAERAKAAFPFDSLKRPIDLTFRQELISATVFVLGI